MKYYGPIVAFTRREFLLSAAALPCLTCLCSAAAPPEAQKQRATYLELAKFILPGSDDFHGEKEAAQVEESFESAFASKRLPLHAAAKGASPRPRRYRTLSAGLDEAVFDAAATGIQQGWQEWIASLGEIRRAQFFVLPGNLIRYEVASVHSGRLEYRVGLWKQIWNAGQIIEFSPVEEHLAAAPHPWFRDVTAAALSQATALSHQFTCGVPYWRARLDPASGIDLYGSNGVAVGDIDNDGMDEVYACQPGGLPNRLLKIHPDGTVTDLSRSWALTFWTIRHRRSSSICAIPAARIWSCCAAAVRSCLSTKARISAYAGMRSGSRPYRAAGSQAWRLPISIATAPSIYTSAATCIFRARRSIRIQHPTTTRATARRIIFFATGCVRTAPASLKTAQKKPASVRTTTASVSHRPGATTTAMDGPIYM